MGCCASMRFTPEIECYDGYTGYKQKVNSMIQWAPELSFILHSHALSSFIGAAIIGAFLIYLLLYRSSARDNTVSSGFIYLQAAALLYVGGYALYASAQTPAGVLLWTRVCFTGAVLTPLALLQLIKALTHQSYPRLHRLALGITLFWCILLWASATLVVTPELYPITRKGHPTLVKGPWIIPFIISLLGLAFAVIVSYALYLKDHAAERQIMRPLTIAFGVLAINGVHDAFSAVGFILYPAQPWIGAVVLVLLHAVYTGNLVRKHNRTLERRLQEFNSLQEVGQALSRTLALDTVLATIYTHVSQLIPASIFYVALNVPETDEIIFPIFIEEGQRKAWPPRQHRNGLTEYVLRTGQPLLIRENFIETIKALDIQLLGVPVACWLGVPLRAGNETLGVLTVQSRTVPRLYDESHVILLSTIAAQAAVAIQNARLYAQTDAALTQRLQELNSILQSTRDGILLTDRDLNVLAASRALTDFLGVTWTTLRGQNLSDLRTYNDQPLAERTLYVLNGLTRDCDVLLHGNIPLKRQKLPPPPAVDRYLERTLTAVRDPQSNVTGWLLIFRDITEEQTVIKMREDMTNMLVHDLRSPTATLQTSLEVLHSELEIHPIPHALTILGIAQQGAERILNLINQLLLINKLEDGSLPLDIKPTSLAAILDKAITEITPLAAEAHVEITLEVPSDLPIVHVDPELVYRVFNNLLDNAIKFTPPRGYIRVWVKHNFALPHPKLLIGISDSGPGISPASQASLFRKFSQVPVPGAKRRGTGLGLAFCKLAIEAHNGRIWVESQPGDGATFKIELPQS